MTTVRHAQFYQRTADSPPVVMSRLLLAPPATLHSLVRYFHVEAATASEVALPATPFPAITIFLSGASSVRSASGIWETTPDAFIAGPVTRASRYRTTPGTAFVSALLRPGSLSRITAIPAQLLTDARWPLTELRPPADASSLLDRIRSHASPHVWVRLLGEWLVHLAAVRDGVGSREHLPNVDRLFDDPRCLAGSYGLGVRQFERRFLATYGQSLRDMRRVTRFVNALSGLMSRRYAYGDLTRLSLDCGYFDHAHMTRDFAALAGASPSRIALSAASDPALKVMHYEGSELDVVLA